MLPVSTEILMGKITEVLMPLHEISAPLLKLFEDLPVKPKTL